MPTLILDDGGTYPDLAIAIAAMVLRTPPGCLFEALPLNSFTRTAFGSSFAGGVLTATNGVFSPSGTVPGSGASVEILTRVYIKAAVGAAIGYNFTGYSLNTVNEHWEIAVYKDDQVTLVADSSGTSLPASGTFNATVPVDGYYWILASASSVGLPDEGDAAASASLSIAGGPSFNACKVRAAYDDGGGGTDYVACTP